MADVQQVETAVRKGDRTARLTVGRDGGHELIGEKYDTHAIVPQRTGLGPVSFRDRGQELRRRREAGVTPVQAVRLGL